MTEIEKEFINLIRNHDNKEEAVATVIDIITYLAEPHGSSAMRVPSSPPE